MMTGEDEPFGSRKIRYDDEAYCMEAHGLLDKNKKTCMGCRIYVGQFYQKKWADFAASQDTRNTLR